MNIDAGARMRELRHHARDERHAQQQQFVGDAIDRYRFQAGIAEDDFVIALGRWITLEGGLHVLLQFQAHVRQTLEQFDGFLLSQSLAVDGHAHLDGQKVLFVAQSTGNLLRKLVVQAVNKIADVILDIADVQILFSPVARIENVEQVAENFSHDLAAGQRFVTEVAGTAALGISGDNAFDDFRQCFLESDVGSHRLLAGLIEPLRVAAKRIPRR